MEVTLLGLEQVHLVQHEVLSQSDLAQLFFASLLHDCGFVELFLRVGVRNRQGSLVRVVLDLHKNWLGLRSIESTLKGSWL